MGGDALGCVRVYVRRCACVYGRPSSCFSSADAPARWLGRRVLSATSHVARTVSRFFDEARTLPDPDASARAIKRKKTASALCPRTTTTTTGTSTIVLGTVRASRHCTGNSPPLPNSPLPSLPRSASVARFTSIHSLTLSLFLRFSLSLFLSLSTEITIVGRSSTLPLRCPADGGCSRTPPLSLTNHPRSADHLTRKPYLALVADTARTTTAYKSRELADSSQGARDGT